ncbi:MAG: endonuclease III domain-containing protein [Thermoplasmatota archaeon]
MQSFSTSWFMMVHTRLNLHFGEPRWWPGETPFEVAVGAVLTQNTAWSSVEKAIDNLKGSGMLDPMKINKAPADLIAELVHPTGYRNQKAAYLKVLASFIVNELDGNIASLSNWGTERARSALLSLKGIGEETADSILCYAASKPVFVVDAYTRRVLSRMDPALFNDRSNGNLARYAAMRSLVMEKVRGDALLYNRFHALFVILAKENCRSSPRCGNCPVRDICATGGTSASANE